MSKSSRVIATVLVFTILGPIVGYFLFHREGLSHLMANPKELEVAYLIGGPFAFVTGMVCAIWGARRGRLPLYISLIAGVFAGLIMSFIFFSGPATVGEVLMKTLSTFLGASLACGLICSFIWRQRLA